MDRKEVEAERRKHPRVSADTKIKLKVSDDSQRKEEEFKIGKVINISLSGMYCSMNKFIPLFTKVEGLLPLPFEKKKNSLVHFIGVVVRSEPEKETKKAKIYKIGIFFQEINEE